MRSFLSCSAAALLLGVLSPLNVSAKIEEPDVAIDSPRNLQVIQRQTKASGMVVVSGKVKADSTGVEVRITGKGADGAEVPNNWRPVALDKTSHGFFSQIEVPAGGWYKLEVHGKK